MPRVATLNAGTSRADHAAVEDDRRVGAALVGLEELDDRVAAGLLLAVAAEADVDRQLAGPRELARGGEQHVELALVVDRAAAVEVAVADLGLERRRSPRARAGRAAARRSGRSRGPSARRRRPTRRISPIASGCPCQSTSSHSPPAPRTKSQHPLARAHDVAGVRRVGADRGNAQELGELVEPGLGQPCGGEPTPTVARQSASDDAARRASTRRRGASAPRRARGASSATGSRSGGSARA